jgi:hypothetical protein
MKRTLILLALLVFGACPAAAASKAALNITRCEAVQAFGAPSYIIIDVEYPQDLEKTGEEILVNGRPAYYGAAGGGFGGGMNQNSYLVYVGAPGTKDLKVTLKAGGQVLTATRTMEFRSAGDIILLNRMDGEAIFAPGEFRFFGYFVRDVAVTVNGRQAPCQQEPLKVSAAHFLLRCSPELKQGDNTLTVSWQGADGQAVSRQYQVYLAQDGVVKQGDTIKLTLGPIRSKSGPFYRAEIIGSSLEAAGQSLADEVTLGKRFFLGKGAKLFAIKVRAKAPGAGIIKVFVRKFFLNPYEFDREIKLTVVQ